MVDGGSTVSVTAYMGAFVAQNGSLNYVTTTEGRMRISGGTAVYEYFIRDQLGAVRASFEKGSAGTAVLRQENSYYGYGLVHSATITPTDANKELYNGGSLWENDFGNDPDLYSTGIRQYAPLLGRFNGTDPMAAKYAMLSPYQYAFNNPISFSDPTGADPDYSEWWDMFWQDIYYNPAYQYGGYWNDPWKGTNTFMGFNDHWAAFNYYADMLDQQQGWRQTTIGNYDQAYDNMVNKIGDVDIYGNVMLRSVSIREMNSNSNWLSGRIDEVWGMGGQQSSGGLYASFLSGLRQVNEFLPTTHILNSITYAFSGQNIYGEEMTLASATIGAASIIPIGKVGGAAVKGLGSVAAKTGMNTLTRSESVLGHVFRDAAGHVNPSTVTSQGRYINLFENVANNSANLNPNVLTSFQRTAEGFQGFAQTFRNGSQVWIQTINGKIINAGVNIIPK